MPTDTIGRDVIDDVRAACEKTGRPTTPAEVQRALEPLTRAELDTVRRMARSGVPAKPLGPDALVDIVRGIEPSVAAARELGGYYALKAERDALARMAAHRAKAKDEDEDAYESDEDEDGYESHDDDEDADDDEDEGFYDPDADAAAAAEAYAMAADDADEDRDEPVDEEEEEEKPRAAPPDALGERVKLRPPMSPQQKATESEALMTLFAYHRDGVRVAQELAINLAELNDRVEQLGLKRRIHRLLETTTDIDMFSPTRLKASKGEAQPAPVVRKRGERPTPPPPMIVERPDFHASREEPAARTEPVNAHGTRVYRRVETREEAPSREAPAAPRREYVRETRRQAKAASRGKEAPKEPVKPPRAPFSDLQGAGGRSVLERLLADEKANPRVLAGKLAERFEGPGRELTDGDLRQLLQHHGLTERFHGLEIANTRFLIGFHQGAKAKLANALQLTPTELPTYLAKIGLAEELERTRAERARLELGRKKISDRLVQVLTRAPYLDDLGVLGVIDREVREHIQHLFAERETRDGTKAQIAEAVRAQLAVEPNAFAKLLRRYEMDSKLAD